jgi:hypothetical protein
LVGLIPDLLCCKVIAWKKGPVNDVKMMKGFEEPTNGKMTQIQKC